MKPLHEFTIPVADLDAAGRSFRFPVRARWMRGSLEKHEATAAGPDGELDVRASRSGNDVVIHGTLKAELTIPCARCLTPVTVRVDDPVSVLMVPRQGEARHASEHEITADEADSLTYDGETVILDQLVREELILETPTFPLCSEECPGIRPSPEGAHKNDAASGTDPRLLPLLRYKRVLDKE
jgi:uncharacterized protein